jgi:hypothetical protein
MDRRGGFQDSDFIVARKGEIKAEVLFHFVLHVQRKLLLPEGVAIIEAMNTRPRLLRIRFFIAAEDVCSPHFYFINSFAPRQTP